MPGACQQADEIMGGHDEGELPIDLGLPAVPHLAQTGPPFWPS